MDERIRHRGSHRRHVVAAMTGKIQIIMSHNERGSGRDTALARAVAEDARFELPEFADIPVDLQFKIEELQSWPIDRDYEGKLWREPEMVQKTFSCELKTPADYLASALGNDGHLAMQYLDMAEAGHRCMILVLGSDEDVSQAIYDSLKTRYRGKELAFQVGSYEKRIQDFEANAEALMAPVRRWKARPYARLLSTAHKILTGASLTGYGPRPKEHERELISANCLFRGIGPEILSEVLHDYRLALVPRKAYARPVEEMPKIGAKRAAMLNSRIVMFYGAMS
jgi:hypothetical protein